MLLPDDYQVYPVGCAMLMFSAFRIFFETPEEGRGIKFSRKPAILANCTTTIVKNKTTRGQFAETGAPSTRELGKDNTKRPRAHNL